MHTRKQFFSVNREVGFIISKVNPSTDVLRTVIVRITVLEIFGENINLCS